jgi:hypothetical protein
MGSLCANSAFADTSELSASSLKEPELGDPSDFEIQHNNLFKIQQSNYLAHTEPAYRNGAEAEDMSLILRIDQTTTKNGHGVTKLNGKDEFSTQENWNYGDVFEFYMGYKSDTTEISLGRKLETWASWENEWRQGFFQPRYM